MNDYIRKTRKLLEKVPRSVYRARSNGSSSTVLERFLLRGEKKSYIVSQAETHLEFGHPSVPSAALLLWTTDPSLVADGRVAIVGNDIGRLKRGRYSFAQVVLVGGIDLEPEHLSQVKTAVSAVGQLDGCMARLMDEKIWVRVSSEAVRDGFSFGIWGEYLLKTIRDAAPSVESVEVIFLANMDDQVKEIMQLAKSASEKRREELLERFKEKTGKDYECDNPYDCDSCPDKTDCDALQEVAQEVRERKLHAVALKNGGI